MSRIHYSLAGLLAFTVFVGFMCAALRYATDLWTSAAVSLSALLLLLAALAAVLRPAARPFWTGFALFGLAYFYVSVGPGCTTLSPRLATTPLLECVESKWAPPASLAQTADDVAWALDATVRRNAIDAIVLHKLWAYQQQPVYSVLPPTNFQAIGHSAFAILIGFVGGIAGYAVQGRTRHVDPQGATT
jgi:hypothetical protein